MPDPETKSTERFTWWDALFLALLPVAAWQILGLNPWNQRGFVDPWFYTGAGQAFEELVTRYGWAYYFIRFPVVFLNTLFCSGEDAASGYLVLRYLLLTLVIGSIFLFASRRYGRAVAAAAVLLFFCEPQFLRSVLWDYPPFLSLTAGLAGIFLWVHPGRWGLGRAFLAGGLFCAAANSNVFIVTLIGCFGAAWMAVSLAERQFRAMLGTILAALAGFVAVLGLGMLYLESRVESFHPMLLWTVTVDALRAGNNYAAEHSTSILTWGPTLTHVYVPFLATCAALMLSVRSRSRRDLILPLTAALYCLFFAAYAAKTGTFVLETFYYFVHLAAVTTLVTPVILGELAARAGKSAGPVLLATVVVGFALVGWATLFNQRQFSGVMVPPGWPTVGVLAAIAVAAATVARFVGRPWWIGAAAVALFGSMSLLNLSQPVGRAIYRNPWAVAERENYEIGVELARYWARHAGVDGSYLLWFNRSDRVPELFGVSFVTLCDALSEKWGDPEGMPKVGDYELKRLRERGRGRLILLATDRSRIAAGREALRAQQVAVVPVDAARFAAGSFVLEAEVVDFTAGPDSR